MDLRPLVVVAFLLVLSFVSLSFAIRFDTEIQKERCLKEELSRDILVIGNYSTDEPSSITTMSFQIMDSRGQVIFKKDGDSGVFAFTTDTGGEFQFCFNEVAIPGQRIPYGFKRRTGLEVKTGVDAKDYVEVATKENLNKLELEVRKIEDGVMDILKDMKYMTRREEKMRNTNESTNSRVMWLSLFYIAVLLGLGSWQIFYLKKYFQQKKLL